MMCHPTTGDLLRGRADRLLPGVRVRRGLRSGRHVLDLYGRVQGSRTGCMPACSTRAAEAGTDPRCTRPEALISAEFSTPQQQQPAPRVVTSELAHPVQPESVRRIENVMPEMSTLVGFCEGLDRVSPASRQRATPVALPSPIVVAAQTLRCNTSTFDQVSRRTLRTMADGEPISTGTTVAPSPEGLSKTSVIVLVTTSGNVTACAN